MSSSVRPVPPRAAGRGASMGSPGGVTATNIAGLEPAGAAAGAHTLSGWTPAGRRVAGDPVALLRPDVGDRTGRVAAGVAADAVVAEGNHRRGVVEQTDPGVVDDRRTAGAHRAPGL